MPAKYLLPIILLVLSTLTHFVGLTSPHQVIFDEVHFGKFVTAYCCTGQRFFDIHPPHAKLLIAGAAKLGGYQGGFPFENISQPYGDVPIFALRFVPALAGTLLPLVIYLLMRQLGAGKEVAVLAGVAVILDNALTIQARVIALDGVLLLATFGSLSAYLAGERRQHIQRWFYFIAAGALAGLAVGTKFTGLAALGLLGVLVFVRLLQPYFQPRYVRSISSTHIMQWIGSGVTILGSAALVYLLGWALHFMLLPLSGSGDAFHVPTTLTDEAGSWLPDFLAETATLHRVMFEANYNLTATHPDSSPWWSWPFMTTSVFYWQESGGQGLIYFLGNPVLWWGVTALGLALITNAVIRFGQRRRSAASTKIMLWIPLVGYAIAMIPLIRVPRALFLYHYLTPLLFALLAGLLWLEQRGWFGDVPTVRRQRALLLSLLLLIGFIWFSPLTFGFAVSPSLHPLLFWLPSWR